MEEHELHMIVKFRSEPGWKAANEVALSIGNDLMERVAVYEVEGSVDPDVIEGRIKIRRLYD